MPVSIYDLSVIVVIHAAIQFSGLLVLIGLSIWGFRELRRLSRATAGLVYQESEKTRARIDDVLRQLPD